MSYDATPVRSHWAVIMLTAPKSIMTTSNERVVLAKPDSTNLISRGIFGATNTFPKGRDFKSS